MPCKTGNGSKCRSCGAPIKWVNTSLGKKMPVDERLISIMEDPDGDTTVVCQDGMVVKGRLAMTGTDGAIQGHTSHFATCPQAREWRKS
jgi:hypothetical protein